MAYRDLRGFNNLVLLYINLACLSVCLYPINVKTAEPIWPKFLWDITCPQGRFMNDQNFKYLSLFKY